MKRAALITYLLAVHVALGYLLWTGMPPAIPPHVAEMRVVYHWRDATTPVGSPVFLGDSLTERMAVAAVEPGGVNFGIGRQTSTHMLEAMPKAARSARRVYLLIGTNDLLQGQRAQLEANLPRISDAIPGELVWTGIMLRQAEPINARIRTLCESRPNCRYVEPLTDPRLFVDGVHLSPAGYAEWVARMRQATP